ncbi:tetratricopeptide repeat protein [Cupriavidus basilensis]
MRWVVGLLLATALATPQQELRAQTSAPEAAPPAWRFADLWLTHDQQGRLAFERGDYAGAAALFDDPMWRGVAQYRAGQYAKAVQSFALMDSPESDFNQGDALARQGKYKAAAARYRQALKRRPQWPAATANLALVEKLAAQAEQPKEGEEPPDIKPDEVKYDSESKPPEGDGKKTEMGAVQSAETWMRAIQTTPTELLQRKFALQQRPGAAGRRRQAMMPARRGYAIWVVGLAMMWFASALALAAQPSCASTWRQGNPCCRASRSASR